MNFGESLVSALSNLAAHKLRSLLTMLGMIFGVGAVIAMLSIGAGAELQAMELSDRMGLRNVLVRDVDRSEDELNEIRRNSLGVSLRDANVISDGIPGVELAVPRVEIDSYKIMSVDGRTAASVLGVSWRQRELSDLRVAEGRFIDRLDEDRHAQVAVVGAGVRRPLWRRAGAWRTTQDQRCLVRGHRGSRGSWWGRPVPGSRYRHHCDRDIHSGDHSGAQIRPAAAAGPG
jgi:putative ABC transport system permease protein